MINFDRIGDVLSSKTDGIVPMRFFCSCRALLNHVRVTESDLRDLRKESREMVTSTCFALGISLDSILAVQFLNSVLELHSLDEEDNFAFKHPNASLRHLLDASISTRFRMKYAEPILKGYSHGYYDIPFDSLTELVEDCDSIYQSPDLLYRLVTNRHFDIATLLLQKSNQTLHTESGRSVMHMLARDGDVTGLRWCIDNGCDIDIVDNNGWSPLSYAVHGGHVGAIKFFLDKNVRTDIVDITGNSLLHLACMGGSLEVAELSSKKGFDIVGCCDSDGLNCLHISAKYGHWKVLEWCLENGLDPNVLDSNGLSPLHHAASADSSLSVSALHTRGASYPISTALESPLLVAVRNRRVDVLHKLIDLYGLESELSSAFQVAFSLGYSEVVEAILHHCNTLNELWDKPEHVLSVAISSNNPIMMRMLLRRPDVDINEVQFLEELGLSLAREQYELANDLIGGYILRGFAMDKLVSLVGSSKLSLASLVDVSVENSFMWLLELCLYCGISVDHKTAELDKTLLICASERGCSGIVEILLRRGANLNATDRNGKTSLMYASEEGHVSCVNVLLSHGADVNVSDNYGKTSLMYASEKGHTSCVELLLNRGADVNASRYNGMTSLMAASFSGHSSCVEILLNHSADVNASAKDGMTSLIYATVCGHSSCVEVLLNHGANVNASTFFGMTPLMYALEGSHLPCVELLLNRGANVDASRRDGMTSLMFACEKGHSSCVKLFLSRGADVNSSTASGMTSLIYASLKGHTSCVELLLSHGADVNVSDMNEMTSLMYASYYGHSSCVYMLRNAGATLESETPSGAL